MPRVAFFLVASDRQVLRDDGGVPSPGGVAALSAGCTFFVAGHRSTVSTRGAGHRLPLGDLDGSGQIHSYSV